MCKMWVKILQKCEKKAKKLTFSEFLIADGLENLVKVMEQITEIQTIPKIFESQLIERLKIYYIVGGMPEAVYSWVNEKVLRK